MSADFIAPILPISEPDLAAPPGTTASVDGGRAFSSLVTAGLRGVGEQLQTSHADLQRLAVGDTTNLHQLMIRLEESRLSFQLMLQVRNRLLEAYQDVMRMQV